MGPGYLVRFRLGLGASAFGYAGGLSEKGSGRSLKGVLSECVGTGLVADVRANQQRVVHWLMHRAVSAAQGCSELIGI